MRVARLASIGLVAVGGVFGGCAAEQGSATDSNPVEGTEEALGTTSKGGVAAWTESTSSFTPMGAHASASGNIVVVGEIMGTATLGGLSLTSPPGTGPHGEPDNEQAIAVFVLDGATGAAKWGNVYGTTGPLSNIDPSDFDVDAAGNIAIVGVYFRDQVTLCGQAFPQGTVRGTGFAMKLAPDGTCLWADYAGAAFSGLTAVAFDGKGNLVAAGGSSGTYSFAGATGTTSAGFESAVVYSLDGATGAVRWADTYGDPSSTGFQNAKQTNVGDLAVDAKGNVVLGGYFQGTVNFGGRTLTASGAKSAFVLQLGNDGSYRAVHYYGSDAEITAVALDAKGELAIGGDFLGAMHFGGGVEVTTPGTTRDGFVAKFDASGNPYFAKHLFGSMQQFSLDALDFDHYGQVIAAGNFGGGEFQVGSYTFTAAANDRHAWLTKLSMTQGTTLLAKAYGSDGAWVNVGSTKLTADDAVPFAGGVAQGGSADFGNGPVPAGDAFVAKLQH